MNILYYCGTIMQCIPGAQGGNAEGGGWESLVSTLVLMALIFGIFYFLLIRPQQKKQKELKRQIESMQKGDRFVTVGGLYGNVVGIKENVITAKIAENVKVEISKSAVSAVLPKE